MGGRVRVNVKFVEVATGNINKSIKIDGTMADIFNLQDRIVITLMQETKKIRIARIEPVNFNKNEKEKIKNKTKPKEAAFKWYSIALEIEDTNPRKALEYFKKALSIRPYYLECLSGAGFTAGNTLNLFSEALIFLNRAKNILEKLEEKNLKRYTALMNIIGIVYWKKGK